MSFNTKGAKVDDGVKVGKYLSYGVQMAAIMGYELKKSSRSDKQQVILLMESPKVEASGFEPDEKAKIGGKVGRVQMTIYFSKDDKSQVDDFISAIATIAKKLGVTEKVDAIESVDLESYMDKLLPIIRGKMAWWGITATEYLKADKSVGYTLGLRRYGFVASLEEMQVNPQHLRPFDKTSSYDYKAIAVPSQDPDFNQQAPEDELPWG